MPLAGGTKKMRADHNLRAAGGRSNLIISPRWSCLTPRLPPGLRDWSEFRKSTVSSTRPISNTPRQYVLPSCKSRRKVNLRALISRQRFVHKRLRQRPFSDGLGIGTAD